MDAKEIAQLRWRCRRGMRELDKLTEHFLNHHYAEAPLEQRKAFGQILDLPDPELLALVLDRAEPSDESIQIVLDKMRSPR